MDERRPARIALYGHDTMGLGHLRRNLVLAAALRSGLRSPQILLISGAAEAGRFPLPDGVDLLVLPSVAKDADGSYRSGRWALPLADVIRLRSQVLAAGLTAFAPDLLVVDKVARGFAGELEPALAGLHTIGTRLVLGLRDILDGPAAAAAEWRRGRTTEALREHYDEVWVYGDPRIADPVEDLALPPSVRRMVRHAGYLAAPREAGAVAPPVPGPHVLCLLGGGQDGAELATTFAAAPRPAGTAGVVVAGPYLPAPARAALHATPGLHVVDFCPDPAAWLPGACAVVGMGGYNTVVEILATDTPALVVPRTAPRSEQRMRARRLSEHGAVDDVHPDDLTPGLLGDWLDRASTLRTPRTDIDLGGSARVPAWAHRLVREQRRAA
ncbi:glycosyltransferase [Pseudonocardia sp. NPDC049635]|uniref:glycosyltransferase family protein n=1 Tax=Pseudonocardia sp. NPDC049635 TaxID=3155506 RepID=UPI003410889D